MNMSLTEAKLKIDKTVFKLVKYGNSCKAKSIFECPEGHVWESTLNRVCNIGHGCPKCPKRKPTTFLEACERTKFLQLVILNYGGGMRKKSTFMCLKCNKSWVTRTSNVLNENKGCPNCSLSNFKKDKNAVIYTLISADETLIKIGVSGNLKKRLRYLKQNTPFKFNLLSFEEMSGEEAIRKEKLLHQTLVSAQLSGFNGCTEWFINTKEFN